MKVLVQKNGDAGAELRPVMDVSGLADTDAYKLAAANDYLLAGGAGELTTVRREGGSVSVRVFPAHPKTSIPISLDTSDYGEALDLLSEGEALEIDVPLPTKIPTLSKSKRKEKK